MKNGKEDIIMLVSVYRIAYSIDGLKRANQMHTSLKVTILSTYSVHVNH